MNILSWQLFGIYVEILMIYFSISSIGSINEFLVDVVNVWLNESIFATLFAIV